MFLQVGAFADATKAQNLATHMTQQMPASLNAPVMIDRSASNLYRVRIGPFTNRDAAVEAIAARATVSGESIHAMPFPVAAAGVAAAIAAADAVGRAARRPPTS